MCKTIHIIKEYKSLHLAGTILFGAGIWLVAQIYHIDEHYPNAFFFWGFGAMTMAWATEINSRFHWKCKSQWAAMARPSSKVTVGAPSAWAFRYCEAHRRILKCNPDR